MKGLPVLNAETVDFSPFAWDACVLATCEVFSVLAFIQHAKKTNGCMKRVESASPQI
jgi:hypothetical protein